MVLLMDQVYYLINKYKPNYKKKMKNYIIKYNLKTNKQKNI